MEKRIIEIPFAIDEEFISGVVCTALNGGISYWCESVGVAKKDTKGAKYIEDVIPMGGALTIRLEEPFDEKDTINYELDLDKFCDGFRKYIKWCIENDRQYYLESSDIDATESDIIIQLAIFNEVIFG